MFQFMTKERYDASSIQVLEGLEPVRKRPAMYIGDTSVYGFHHLLTEIINNSVDEALSEFADSIWVILHPDQTVSVIDNGRGIPVDIMTKYKKSALEVMMTTLHSGGKFSGEGYKVSGGLHGVGISVVNAVSERTRVEVKRNSDIYAQEFSRGEPTTKLIKRKISSGEERTPHFSDPWDYMLKKWAHESGTAFTFKPDTKIFTDVTEFDYKHILQQLRDYAFLTAGLNFYLIDDRDPSKPMQEYRFYFEGGIKSFVRYLNRNHHPLMLDPFFVSKDIAIDEKNQEMASVEIAIQYHEEYHAEIMSFVNNIHTHEGGSHEVGFKSALTRVVNDYARKEGMLDNKDNLNGDDIREGMTAVISIKMNSQNLQFEGQTKRKLGNPEIRSVVEMVINEAFSAYLVEHPQEARVIINKAVLAQQARKAAKKARETVLRKSALASAALPGKLVDCREKDPAKSEIYIVEGDSAGGSAKNARDSKYQAVLYLSGKPINAEKNRLDKVLANEKLRDVIIALGSGIGEDLDLEKLRYQRIILMNDADVDGAHITALVLTFMYRQLRELIENGFVYLAQPPLYRIKAGQRTEHAFSDQERDQIINEIVESGANPNSIIIQRFKGLGEMNPDQLWKTTMDPNTRTLKQITIQDAAQADQTFVMLMGDDVLPRKRFIQTHAKFADLDV